MKLKVRYVNSLEILKFLNNIYIYIYKFNIAYLYFLYIYLLLLINELFI